MRLMPGTPPSIADEREQLLLFIAQQRDVLRIAAYGLTDEQARATPARSSLSVGGLVKHVAFTEDGWAARIAGRRPATDDADYAAYADSHTLRPDETLAGALAALADAAAATEAAAAGVEDLGRELTLPDQPWF